MQGFMLVPAGDSRTLNAKLDSSRSCWPGYAVNAYACRKTGWWEWHRSSGCTPDLLIFLFYTCSLDSRTYTWNNSHLLISFRCPISVSSLPSQCWFLGCRGIWPHCPLSPPHMAVRAACLTHASDTHGTGLCKEPVGSPSSTSQVQTMGNVTCFSNKILHWTPNRRSRGRVTSLYRHTRVTFACIRPSTPNKEAVLPSIKHFTFTVRAVFVIFDQSWGPIYSCTGFCHSRLRKFDSQR